MVQLGWEGVAQFKWQGMIVDMQREILGEGSELARPFFFFFEESVKPFAQGLETAFIPLETTKHSTIIAYLMEYCVLS